MNTRRLLLLSTVAALTDISGAAARAQPLTFQDVPVAQAAAQIGARYGVAVRVRGLGGVRVTFTIDDADAAGARLQAVNALANAAGADFTKAYVIGRSGAGDASPAQIDVTASLPSSQTAYPARTAIAMVAGLDDASARFADDVDGTVTLSGAFLTAAQAAAQIAQQTRTQWGTVYTLEPRLAGRVPGGTVIGRTSGGSPIVQLASVYYHDAAWTAHQKRADEADRQQALAEQQEALAEQAALAQQAASSQRVGTGGFSPANGPYPYGAAGAYSSGNGAIVIEGQSYGNLSPSANFGGGY